MDKVLLDSCEDMRPEYPRDPRPTQTQAEELAVKDTELFDQFAKSRDMRSTVFGVSRRTDNDHVAIGFALLGRERDHVALVAHMAQRLSKSARIALGVRILLDVEKGL